MKRQAVSAALAVLLLIYSNLSLAPHMLEEEDWLINSVVWMFLFTGSSV